MREEEKKMKQQEKKKLVKRGREFTRMALYTYVVCGYIRTTKQPTAFTQTRPQI